MALKFIQGNLACIKADAIVISSNQEPFCSDGVDRTIYEAAGETKMLNVRKMVGRIEVGQAKYTRAFSLSAKYVIHTVSPMWRGGKNGEGDLLRSCYRNSLSLAKQLDCKSIAFSLIGTGCGRVPYKESLQCAMSEFRPYLEQCDFDISLILYDDKAVAAARSKLQNIDIINQKASIPSLGNRTLNVEELRSRVWKPEEHNLYAERPYMKQTQDLLVTIHNEKIKCVKKRKNDSSRGVMALIPAFIGGVPGLVTFAIIALALSNKESKEKKNKYRIIKNKEYSGTNSAVNEVIVARLIERVSNIPKKRFEPAAEYNKRVCVGVISTVIKRDRRIVFRNFNTLFNQALKDIAQTRCRVRKEYKDTDEGYLKKCVDELNKYYKSYNNNKLLLVEAYYNRSCTLEEVKAVVRKYENIGFQEKWKQMFIRDPGQVTEEEIGRLEKVFYSLLIGYICRTEELIARRSIDEQSDFFKVKNYILTHQYDWLYCLTPSELRMTPYLELKERYPELFLLMFQEFFILLKIVGMEEGFEVYCAQSPEFSSIGMNLILVLYELQCKRYIRINEKN